MDRYDPLERLVISRFINVLNNLSEVKFVKLDPKMFTTYVEFKIFIQTISDYYPHYTFATNYNCNLSKILVNSNNYVYAFINIGTETDDILKTLSVLSKNNDKFVLNIHSTDYFRILKILQPFIPSGKIGENDLFKVETSGRSLLFMDKINKSKSENKLNYNPIKYTELVVVCPASLFDIITQLIPNVKIYLYGTELNPPHSGIKTYFNNDYIRVEYKKITNSNLLPLDRKYWPHI